MHAFNNLQGFHIMAPFAVINIMPYHPTCLSGNYNHPLHCFYHQPYGHPPRPFQCTSHLDNMPSSMTICIQPPHFRVTCQNQCCSQHSSHLQLTSHYQDYSHCNLTSHSQHSCQLSLTFVTTISLSIPLTASSCSTPNYVEYNVLLIKFVITIIQVSLSLSLSLTSLILSFLNTRQKIHQSIPRLPFYNLGTTNLA